MCIILLIFKTGCSIYETLDPTQKLDMTLTLTQTRRNKEKIVFWGYLFVV